MAAAQAGALRTSGWLDRWHAWVATRSRSVTAFSHPPEPKTVGQFARGRQVMAGNFLLAGHLVTDPEAAIWDLPSPAPAFDAALHGFGWLDDMAAVGDIHTRTRAQDWVLDWIARYGRGQGPGWVAELAGRRLMRWINHGVFLTRGLEAPEAEAFFRSLARQLRFLSKRWKSAPPGLPRVEALTGLSLAALSLKGAERHLAPALAALEKECARGIDAQGGIASRNPEELLEVFTLLSWTQAALLEAGRDPGPQLSAAIIRIAPTLRSLRHADGGLARFHGGGRGQEGRLDRALAASGVVHRNRDGLSMGYARLSAGRTSVILDAAPPAKGAASVNAHASTLAFELTSGRRPLVVSCGSGAAYGAEWRRAARATPSHSTLCLAGLSSARLEPSRGGGPERLVDSPDRVPIRLTPVEDGMRFQGGHDGYLGSHGLTHARTLDLAFDGRGLAGEDMLVCLEEADKRRFDRAMEAVRLQGIPFALRFHLHPEVEARPDPAESTITLSLKSGETWVFRHEGSFDCAIDPSVYLENHGLKPMAAKQIVLSGRAMGYATRIRWSFVKAQDTPGAIRDLVRDDDAAGGAEPA